MASDKIIPGSPGSASQPFPSNPPTFSPLASSPFGKRTGGPTGSSLSGLATALSDHADKLHPVGVV